MESLSEDPTKLGEVCRACLGPLDTRKCSLEDEGFITKFQAVAGLQVVVNEKFPSYLCSNCEGRTNEAYEFQETCQKSDTIVKTVLGIKQISELSDFENETKQSNSAKAHKKIKKEKTDNALPLSCKVCKKVYTNEKYLEKHMLAHHRNQKKPKSKKQEPESDSDLDYDVSEILKIERESSEDEYQPEQNDNKAKRNTKNLTSQLAKLSNYKLGQPRLKLKQFAKENVDSVIDSMKTKLNSSKTCLFCDFNALNAKSLNTHVLMIHKKEKATWCATCNQIVQDLDEHTKSHTKDFECPFCQRMMRNSTHFFDHVGRHASSTSITYKCQPCDITFENQEILKNHNLETHPQEVKDYSRIEKELKLKKRIKIGLSRGARVAQFPQEEVEAVVKKAQIRMNSPADCPVCNFNAVNTRALSTHMSITHKEEKPRWCYFCNKLNIENLKEHKEQMHSQEYVCEFCGKNHKNVTNYIEHLTRHSESKNFHCPVCEKSFINIKYLEKHKKIHDEVHHLEQGNESSDDDKKLSDFIKKSYNIVNKSDNITMKVENENEGEKSLTENMKIEIEDNDFILIEKTEESPIKPTNHNKFCKVCNKGVQNLERHVKKYHTPTEPEPPSLCPQCGKLLKNRAKLNIHLRLHSGIQPYKCQFCPKAFLMNSHLKLHIRTHTKEKPYICQVCGKSFAQTSMLSTHMRIHTGRPHQCKICEQRFCRPSELRIHMRKHTGEKPYICEICCRGFKQTSHLVDHKRTHFDDRPYQCSYCDKAFKNVATLKAHEFIHTGTKPFKCSKCPFTCRVSYHLTKHMMTHDSDRPMMDKPYSCEICTKNFQTKAHLFSHFDRYHNSSQNQQMQEDVITETIPHDGKIGTEITFYA